MNIDNLKKYIATRINDALTVDVYTKEAEFDTLNNPETSTTEPYVVIRSFTLIEKLSSKYKYNVEIEIHDFTNNSTTANGIAEDISDELDMSWQSESDMFFRIDKDWESDILSDTPDKSRIDQRYELNVYDKS